MISFINDYSEGVYPSVIRALTEHHLISGFYSGRSKP